MVEGVTAISMVPSHADSDGGDIQKWADVEYELARHVAPYEDDDVVRQMTQQVVQAGHRILQIHMLGSNDDEHIASLLSVLNPPPGAVVLDAGCGVGAVAELMAQQRPDLEFVLLNISPAQLAMCPDRFRKLEASFHDIPLPDASVDVVMFCYSLGHGRLDTALGEAARVLRPGGILFIYDITVPQPGSRIVVTMGYVPHPARDVVAVAERCGFVAEMAMEPAGTSTDGFVTTFGRETFDVFTGARPVIYRMRKA